MRKQLQDMEILVPHVPTDRKVPGVGSTDCFDERCAVEEIQHTVRVQGVRPVASNVPGGGIRLSRHCPIPMQFYRDQVERSGMPIGISAADEDIRAFAWDEVKVMLWNIYLACAVRGVTLYKLNTHGPHCGWAHLLGLTLTQRLWLLWDARWELKTRARAGKWLAEGQELEVYCAYHEHYVNTGEERHHTYSVNVHHSLFQRVSLGEVLAMSDEDFFRSYAPGFLESLERQDLLTT